MIDPVLLRPGELQGAQGDPSLLPRTGCHRRACSQVRGDGLPHLHQFVDGLERDQEAVTAGLSSHWSSGQVEGRVTRARLLKRAGYGRAKLDLLRVRILLRT
ncbi:transposase [Streptomyces sp. NPDC055025]